MACGEAAQRLLHVTRLNATPATYAPILRLQEALFEARRRGDIPDTLLQLEHSHVYTIGKRGGTDDFHTDEAALRASGAEVCTIPRGGETTYHGPGQLVLYPILSLRQLGLGARAYVEGLEDAMVAALGHYGVAARGRVPGKTGVWVGERKIGAIGVRISQGFTCHGLALNVATDLSHFAHIVPCGTPDKEVTSLHRQLAGAQHAAGAAGAAVAAAAAAAARGAAAGSGHAIEGAAGAAAGTAALAAAVAGAPAVTAPPLAEVSAALVDAFALQFGYARMEQLPDVNQLAAELGVRPGPSL
ncbi:octanoyltransferase [Micractinium conductrix]|uniref:lipoyl(octanoyl) transferase n=1 Tax=Micractinium conductrix TaxID=554055 RepID=A0A2P6VML8_9CHLO|nr:octanoyltransferase [Micractinium conductrix]|eukprot:PSC75351.1 octanoyltransferase [Micractinium conductrix]